MYAVISALYAVLFPLALVDNYLLFSIFSHWAVAFSLNFCPFTPCLYFKCSHPYIRTNDRYIFMLGANFIMMRSFGCICDLLSADLAREVANDFCRGKSPY